MKKLVLILASLAMLVALALLAHEVQPTAPVRTTSATTRHAGPRIVLPAGMEAPVTIDGDGDTGVPEIAAPPIDTLATMPAAAPERPDTMDAPRLPVL